jgi:lipoprotein-anchoring transpeptidase ErfK/SrfK
VTSTSPTLTKIVRFFGHGGGVAFYLVGAVLLVTAGSSALFASTAYRKLQRDVARLVFEDNLDVLESVQWSARAVDKSLRDADAAAEPPADRPYLVISIEDKRLWFKQGGEVLFTTQVATGSGKTLVGEGSGSHWKFDTPRGRLVVQSKEESPDWVPPDWHFIEEANKRRLGLARVAPGQPLTTSDGSVIAVRGDDLVRRGPDGRETVLAADEGREIVADGKIVIPPVGTNQRRYKGILGTHRLNMGNGYAIHGTNQPQSIGHAVSHGCVRVLNEDIDRLYATVPVGTPVYIY